MVVDEVGEGSMGFSHTLVCKDWSQTWVLIECVGEDVPWTQSTHRQHEMFWVCIDQIVKGEEHQVIWYKGTSIKIRLIQIVGPL